MLELYHHGGRAINGGIPTTLLMLCFSRIAVKMAVYSSWHQGIIEAASGVNGRYSMDTVCVIAP